MDSLRSGVLPAKNEMESERKAGGEYHCQELKQTITDQDGSRIQGDSFIPTGGAVHLLFFHDSLSSVSY